MTGTTQVWKVRNYYKLVVVDGNRWQETFTWNIEHELTSGIDTALVHKVLQQCG